MINMTFNYRILVSKEEDNIYFDIHRVYYENGEIVSYGETPISLYSESIDEISNIVEKIKDCLTKPALWSGDKFPREYESI